MLGYLQSLSNEEAKVKDDENKVEGDEDNENEVEKLQEKVGVLKRELKQLN